MGNVSEIGLLHEVMQREKIVLTYVGVFDQETIKSMLKYTESKFETSGLSGLVRKKIFNVMTEMLQNISKHQHEVGDDLAVFVLGEVKNGFYILTANNIHNDKIELVEEKISNINRMTKDELKEFYKQSRLKATISEVGGAGLGFIDIVRKSENPLEFKFIDKGEIKSTFVLKAIINNNENL